MFRARRKFFTSITFLSLLVFGPTLSFADDDVYWYVIVNPGTELSTAKFPTAETACAAGIAEKESRHDPAEYEWRIVGDFYSGGSYTDGNMPKGPQDSGFNPSARSLNCTHEYHKNTEPADWWSTFWPYSGAEVRMGGSACASGTTWSESQLGCIAPHSPETGDCSCGDVCVGNPIRVSTGNKFQKETDYIGKGPFPLSIKRYYNSVLGGWSFTGQEKLVIRSSGGNTGLLDKVEWLQESGKMLTFNVSGSIITYRRGTSPKIKLTHNVQQSQNPDGQYIVDTKGNNRHFSGAAQGNVRLSSVTDPHGNTHTYSYSPSWRLETITHSSGDQLSFEYNLLGQISSITTQDGEVFEYGYNEHTLTSSTMPNATSSRIYHYETSNPKLLTGISDENGVRYVTWAYDEDGKAILSEHAGSAGRVTLVPNETGGTTVRNSLGKDTTYHFTQFMGMIKVERVEGHASGSCAAANQLYTYTLDGLVETQTDWKGNVTSFEYDDRGLQTRRTEAVGSSEERTITTEWHSQYYFPIKITEPNRQTTFTYDDKGYLINKVVSPSTLP